MDIESLLVVGPFLPEDKEFLREVLKAEPMQRAFAQVVRGRATTLAGHDLVTEEGLRRAAEAQGIERGVMLFVEDLIQLSQELNDESET